VFSNHIIKISEFHLTICPKCNTPPGEDNVREVPKCGGCSVYEAISKLSKESLWTEARDLLFLHCEPVWVEFTGGWYWLICRHLLPDLIMMYS